jgi:hypothetical protein
MESVGRSCQRVRSPASRQLSNSRSAELSALSAISGVYRAYTWYNVSIIVWCGNVSGADLDEYEKACAMCRESFPEKLSAIHIILPGATQLPGREVREKLSRIDDNYVDIVAAFAVVILGSGFWASAVRGVLTALNMRMRRRTFEMRIHADLEAVVEWLPEEHEERTGVKIAAPELLAALRQAVDGRTLRR